MFSGVHNTEKTNKHKKHQRRIHRKRRGYTEECPSSQELLNVWHIQILPFAHCLWNGGEIFENEKKGIVHTPEAGKYLEKVEEKVDMRDLRSCACTHHLFIG